MKELIDVLGKVMGLGEGIRFWLACLSRPLQTCEEVLARGLSDDAKLFMAFRAMGVLYLLDLAASIPVYAFAGLAWQDLGFVLSRLTLMYGGFLLFALLQTPILRLFSIRVPAGELLLVQSVLFAPFPFLGLVALPLGIKQLDRLRAIKLASPRFEGFVPFLMALYHPDLAAGLGAAALAFYSITMAVAVFVWLETVLVLQAMILGPRHGVEDYRVVSAGNFGLWVVGPVPGVGLTWALALTEYAFLR